MVNNNNMKTTINNFRTGKVDPRPNGNFVVIKPKSKDIKIKVNGFKARIFGKSSGK